MEWVERMRRAMACIEENLQSEIDWEAVGRAAACPGSQFARTFALICDMPLSEYVRLRRLSRAAEDLQGGDRVLDVALRYGYASPTAFQRAFTAFHGVTPRAAQKPGCRLRAYPPMHFDMTIQGGTMMEYRIETRQAMRMLGQQVLVSTVNGANMEQIPRMWQEFPEARCAALFALADGEKPDMYGVMKMLGDTELTYAIAVESGKAPTEDWMTAIDIAPATYAVFETTLADMQPTTQRIYAQWLPNSGYEHTFAHEFERYPSREGADAAQYLCEIWIPVRKV